MTTYTSGWSSIELWITLCVFIQRNVMPQLQARGNKWTNKTKFVWKKRKKKKTEKKLVNKLVRITMIFDIFFGWLLCGKRLNVFNKCLIFSALGVRQLCAHHTCSRIEPRKVLIFVFVCTEAVDRRRIKQCSWKKVDGQNLRQAKRAENIGIFTTRITLTYANMIDTIYVQNSYKILD